MGGGKCFPPSLICYGIFSWKVRIQIFSSREDSEPRSLTLNSGHRLGIKLTRKLPSSKWVSLWVSKNSPGMLSHLTFAAIGICPLNAN